MTTTDTLLLILTCIVGLGGFLALVPWAITRLKSNEQGYPYEKQVEAIVLPYATKAVGLAYKASEYFMKMAGAKLSGLDKKAVADRFYFQLPPGVKALITKDQFSEFVQQAYDEMLAQWANLGEQVGKAYSEWSRENGPVATNQDEITLTK